MMVQRLVDIIQYSRSVLPLLEAPPGLMTPSPQLPRASTSSHNYRQAGKERSTRYIKNSVHLAATSSSR